VKLEQAKAFLREQLAGGPVQGRIVAERAEEEGINSRTLRRAREALGVRSIRTAVGQPWLWAMPADTPAISSVEQGVEILPARPSGVSDRETILREISRVYADPPALWAALERHRGLLGPTAETLGVSREALEFLEQEDENVSELVRRAVERALDRTIGRLWDTADQGHVPALGRLLAARAAHRGFGTGGGRGSSDELVDVSITMATSWSGTAEPVSFSMPRAEAAELPSEIHIGLTPEARARLYGQDDGQDAQDAQDHHHDDATA
jgi:hypothetical protein